MRWPPAPVLGAWALALAAAGLVVQGNSHFVLEFFMGDIWLEGRVIEEDVTRFEYYGFFSYRASDGKHRYDEPPRRSFLGDDQPEGFRVLRMCGFWYAVGLATLAAVLVSFPLWYGANRFVRGGVTALACLAPLFGLLMFGWAMTQPFASLASMTVKPTPTTWIAAITWLGALAVSVLALVLERPRDSRSLDPATFD